MIVNIESPAKEFLKHLQLPSNNRILFSGKFGTGKSHFLKTFFDDEQNFASYKVFWISPVNYVVGANQDIFEWIKIDLAKELLSKYTEKQETKTYSENFLIQNYIYQNQSDLFNKLGTIIADQSLKHKTGFSVLDKLSTQIKAYKEFKEAALKSIKTDSTRLEDFIKENVVQQGSIFEDDITTNIIRANIELLKHQSKKECVLIIDDVDRLDPEHIFRILNILSCHNNHFESNKFGFDKVIVVCDIHNVEVIYKHKYGSADFDGYIEKFYTYDPFHYSIKNAIINFCKNQLNVTNIDSDDKNTLSVIMIILFRENFLKIRSLKKILSEPLIGTNEFFHKKYLVSPFFTSALHRTFLKTDNIVVNFNKFGFLHALYLLVIAVGGVNNLQRVFSNIKYKGDSIEPEIHNSLYNSLAILYSLSQNNVNRVANVFYDISDNQHTNYGRILREPRFQVFNKTLSLSLQWSPDNPYDTGHYFENAKIMLDSSVSQITVDMLINTVKSILSFAIKEGIYANVTD